MNFEFYFSIVMATYNSGATIEKALLSIRRQDFSQDDIQILVVDGGSTDETIEIAKRYQATILQNPYRLPEPAKMIGLKYATGKFVCIMDSDEELPNDFVFLQRKTVLEHYTNVKCFAIGLNTPKGSNACCHYINAVGDPFTCFVYSTYKNSMEGLIIKQGNYYEEHNCYIAYYEKDDIRPIGDSGTIMDLQYIKSNFFEELSELTTSAIFDRIIRNTGYVGYIKNDNHNHYTMSSIKTFLNKIKFRIINNIFDINGSGYSSKALINKKLALKKYFFPIYTITIIIPLLDGIRMMMNYKHWIFIMHPIFCLYVLFEVAIQYLYKLLGIKKRNRSYAK